MDDDIIHNNALCPQQFIWYLSEMGSSLLQDYLAAAIDGYVDWFVAWHRLAFIDGERKPQFIETLQAPEAFADWKSSFLASVPEDQPVIEKILLLHEQLHTLSRLVLLRTPEDQDISTDDYSNVVSKFRDLIKGMRRLEHAFTMVASRMDVLTGLRSRLGLRDDLEREMERFKRSQKSFCLAVLDIDFFKKVNDTHGHESGDRVLVAVANHINRSLRIFDDAYRMGGEEFLLCLKEADQSVGKNVLERLRHGIETTPVSLDNGVTISVTASFGMVVSTLGSSLDDMMSRADQALYKAKHEGRNTLRIG